MSSALGSAADRRQNAAHGVIRGWDLGVGASPGGAKRYRRFHEYL